MNHNKPIFVVECVKCVYEDLSKSGIVIKIVSGLSGRDDMDTTYFFEII
jgi:hypothetical protein